MTLEQLVVKIDADLSGLDQAMTATDRAIGNMAERLTNVGQRLTTYVTLPLAAVGAASVKLASDAEAAGAKMDAVFGGARASMDRWIQSLQDTVPRTTAELQAMTAGIQDLLVPLGLAPAAAESMTKQVVQLAADMAAFEDIPMEDALEKIRAGMVGSYEPLLSFGVALNQATVEAKALEMGLISEGETLTAAARAQAAFQLTLEGTAAAHGTAAEEAEGASASFQFFTREVKDLGTTIGRVLLPVVVPLIRRMTDALELFEDLSPTTQKVVVVLGALAAAVGPVIVVLGTLAGSMNTILVLFGTSLPAVFAKVLPFLGPAGLIAAGVIALGLIWVKWGDDITRIAERVYTAVQEWIGKKLTQALNLAKAPIEAVTGWFAKMYDAVVGHSYVPDMVDGISREFARLDRVMVEPTITATNRVSAAFGDMAEKHRESYLAQRRAMEQAREGAEAFGLTLEMQAVKTEEEMARIRAASTAALEEGGFRGSVNRLIERLGESGLVGSIGTLADRLSGGRFTAAINDVLDKFKGPAGIVSAVGDVVEALGGTGFGDAVKSFVSRLLGTAAGEGIVRAIETVIRWANDLIGTLGRLRSAFDQVGGGISIGTGGFGSGSPFGPPVPMPPTTGGSGGARDGEILSTLRYIATLTEAGVRVAQSAAFGEEGRDRAALDLLEDINTGLRHLEEALAG